MSRLYGGRRELVEVLATDVIARNRCAAPPVDIDAVAAAEGLDFELRDLATTDGAYYKGPDGRGHAVINTRQHPLRVRFSKAHELGHHLMDDHPAWTDFTRGLVQSYRGRDRHWAHEYFAACVLMPRAWVSDFIRQRGWKLTRDELIVTTSLLFAVSRPAAEIRLEELGQLVA